MTENVCERLLSWYGRLHSTYCRDGRFSQLHLSARSAVTEWETQKAHQPEQPTLLHLHPDLHPLELNFVDELFVDIFFPRFVTLSLLPLSGRD